MENNDPQETLSLAVGLFEQLPEEIQEVVLKLMKTILDTQKN